ncbi:MAG TPA: acylphosphatase [Alphaproteobacteria bacterium]|nr:acylphosphatase [Alphaproteobacteria bacterium]
MSQDIAVRIFVSGRVQGVWYRGWTVEAAAARSLRGWVRNCRDGRVEALLIGPADAVEAVIRECYRGPPAARVDNVDRIAATDDGSVGFRQRPTV